MNLNLSLDDTRRIVGRLQFQLLEHVRHNLTVVTYGARGEGFNVSLECDDCGVVVVDIDE